MIKRTLLLLLTFSILLAVSGCYRAEPEYKPYNSLENYNSSDYTFEKPKPTIPPQAKSESQVAKSIAGKIVIVDAGHGGKDPGTNGNGVREKDFTLKMAKKVAEKLQAKGCRVIMTRSTDVFIELDARAAAADRYKCDLFVSIHADYIKKSEISGVTVLTGSKATQKSKVAAQSILSALSASKIAYRGTRSQELRVCDGHSRPAILIECGYVSNYQDATNLKNTWYQDKLATAIANGVANYLAK